jgi:hypothetical protein
MLPLPTDHHVRVEAQTWRSTPPYPPRTMYRAVCKCGWRGAWFHYEENVEKSCQRDEAELDELPDPEASWALRNTTR